MISADNIVAEIANLRKMSRTLPKTATRTTTVRLLGIYAKLKGAKRLLEWRNWQTHGTQKSDRFTAAPGDRSRC